MSKSEYPEQVNPTTAGRRAVAPYNFIQLPEQVIAAENAGDLCVHNALDTDPHLVRQDSYHARRHTGQITATLRAVSPIYTRTGLSPEEFAAISGKSFSDLSVAEKQRYAEFFQLNGVPTLPGSSLRGMLRTLIEIVTQSKLTRVMRDGLVYRAVGDTSSLGIKYRARLMREDQKNHFTPIMQAGYIQKQGNQWSILPAKNVGGTTFCRIKIDRIPKNGLRKWGSSYNAYEIWVKPSDPAYQAIRGGFIHIWFSEELESSATDKNGFQKAALCLSGKMNKKRHEMIVFEPDQSAVPIPIDDEMLFSYREQVSKEQRRILGNDGVLVHNQPVFYLVEDEKLVFFGHTFLFRIPYLDAPLDFVSPDLRDPAITDIAEAMFGYVSKEKQAYAGRVFVDDAALVEEQRGTNVWLDLQGQPYLVPQILGSPKPTTFQHYLVQPQENRRELKHYASTPVTETVIRGHKLYWHKGVVAANAIQHPDISPGNEATQHTGMRPVKPDTRFALSIRFENLSDVELGALLWLVQLASDNRYALKLGMGKPLGLGSVQLEGLTVTITDRRARYTTLFDAAGDWETGAAVWDAAPQQACVEAFQSYIVQHSGVAGIADFEQLPRTQQVRCMLAWPGPDPTETKYMQLSQFRDRPILPRPDALCDGGQRTAQAEPQEGRAVPPVPKPALNTTLKFRSKVMSEKTSYYVVELPNNVWAQIGVKQTEIREVRLGKEGLSQRLGVRASTPLCNAERQERDILYIKIAPKEQV